MGKEEKELLHQDFDLWLKTKFSDVFWLKGHKFEKTMGEDVLIDGGLFTKEEATTLFRIFTSRNPFARFNATIMVWERNGILLKIIIALALIALILIYIRIRR
jgi:hypothetical protein